MACKTGQTFLAVGGDRSGPPETSVESGNSVFSRDFWLSGVISNGDSQRTVYFGLNHLGNFDLAGRDESERLPRAF